MVHFALAAPAMTAFAFLGSSDRHPRPTNRKENHYRLPRHHSNIVSPYYTYYNKNKKTMTSELFLSEQGVMAAHSEFSKEHQNEATVHDLCELLGASPIGLLRLESTEADGVRGVYTESAILSGDIIVRVPLEACLLDNEPPEWWTRSKEEQEDDDDAVSSSFGYNNPSEWAPRLAASVIDLQLKQRAAAAGDDAERNQDKIAQGKMQWLSFLPDPDYLRASLPVHWSEVVLQSARCTALELAVDSSYFARAEAVADLMLGLENYCPDAKEIPSEELSQLCQNALDVVQTRSCRAQRADMEEEGISSGFPLRALAPVFDLINHGSAQSSGEGAANAKFGVEDYEDDKGVSRPFLCVRATTDVDANEEVLIDYGDSAKPSWKCCLSYGFVPQYNMPNDDDDDGESDDDVAEVFMDGNRYEVGPTTIPFDLVAAATPRQLIEEGKEVALTPDIALKLAERISTVSFYLLVDERSRQNENQDGSGNVDDDLDSIESAEALTSWQLAASLRWSQHHILQACVKGLQEWASE